jgi:hypothetical protein
MSGWYVKRLLLDRDTIRASLFSSETINESLDSYTEVPYIEDDNFLEISGGDFDVDTYDDLLTVESCLEKLIKNGEIEGTDLEILKSLLEDRDISILVKKFNISISTIYNILERVFRKISENLGGYFTDDGYIEVLRKRYNLSEDQIKMVKKSIRKGKTFI